MALHTQIISAETGEPYELRWGSWHLGCMAAVRGIDDGLTSKEEFDLINKLDAANDPDGCKAATEMWGRLFKHFWQDGWGDGHIAQADYSFTDPSDGEVLNIKKGDKLWTNNF